MSAVPDNPDDKEILEKILAMKDALGEELLILTHHYQRKEIVDVGDFRGDSFGLSQKAAADKAVRFIVFCGVHFMAESAEILSQPHQSVQIPALEAGCWMANMADNIMVQRAWEEVASIAGTGSVMPIVYMNSDADLKAFCGRQGGAVCTSSNALAAFRWGFGRREKVFFFPDQHLGRNTGIQMGIPSEEMILWNPEEPLGGNQPENIKKAKAILWDGYCLVHTRFRVEHMLKMRNSFPEAKIVVHPECTQEVVALADAVGSTSFIVKYVENAPPNSTIIVGTEVNLINRLALENPDKDVLDLHYSLCPNMFRINPKNLLWTLKNFGQVNVVEVPEAIKKDARMALDRMLTLSP
ncbi:MAG: quinolinate synthase NadA [Desulfatiglandales bacterium]|jgi:quinolinate synthase|nr:quinolinate synthase NadA [Desulfatiglandales bacterium]